MSRGYLATAAFVLASTGTVVAQGLFDDVSIETRSGNTVLEIKDGEIAGGKVKTEKAIEGLAKAAVNGGLDVSVGSSTGASGGEDQ